LHTGIPVCLIVITEIIEIKENKPLVLDVPTFKLIKNSRGYNWEIKVVGKPAMDCLLEAEKVNSEAITRFSMGIIAGVQDE